MRHVNFHFITKSIKGVISGEVRQGERLGSLVCRQRQIQDSGRYRRS